MEFERYQRSGLDGKVAWRGEGPARSVDARGRFPRGETFSGYLEFKEQFARHYQEDLVRGLLKKLTLYGTGRIPNVLDLKAIDEIMLEGRKGDYRLQDLLVALLQSPIFRDHQTPKTRRQWVHSISIAAPSLVVSEPRWPCRLWKS